MSINMVHPILVLPRLTNVDLENIITMLDIDDTCWPFIEHVFSIAGVDPSLMYTFAVKDNRYYTAEEKSRIFQAFRDPKTFENIKFYPAVKKIPLLLDEGIKVQISSKSFSDEISYSKRVQFKDAVPRLKDEDFILSASSEDHATNGKQVGREVTFFGDDNPHNIVTSNAVFNLLPCKTWNTSPREQFIMRSKNFYLVTGLDAIIETILASVRSWRQSKP